MERYNRTVRHEGLDMKAFNAIEEGKNTATPWLQIYNNERPRMGLGGITPAMKLAKAANVKLICSKSPLKMGGCPSLTQPSNPASKKPKRTVELYDSLVSGAFRYM